MRLLKGFSDANDIEGEGTPEERKAVQERQQGEKLQRDQRKRIAMNGRCIARADLTEGPLGLLEDINDGAFYRVSNGEHTSEDTFAAFTTAANGDILFLEAPASGPRSRAELDQARADREARRAAPQPRPAWMNQ